MNTEIIDNVKGTEYNKYADFGVLRKLGVINMKRQSGSSVLLNLLQHFRKLNWDKALPGITQPEYLILSAIYWGHRKQPDHPGIYVSKLAESLMTSVSMVSKLLKTLEEKNWILRTVDKNSRRNTFVSLTAEGRRILFAADEAMEQVNHAVAQELGEEKVHQLIDGISALLNSYETVLDGIEDGAE